MDRGAWSVTVHAVAEESDMTERLNNNSKPIPATSYLLWTVSLLNFGRSLR